MNKPDFELIEQNLIRKAEKQIAKILQQLEKDTDKTIRNIEIVNLDMTNSESLHLYDFKAVVRIEMDNIPKRTWL